MNIIAISPKSGMEQAEIIDTFWTYQAAETAKRDLEARVAQLELNLRTSEEKVAALTLETLQLFETNHKKT